MPPYGKTSFDGVRSALKDLARYSTSSEGTFGAPDEVDPVHHLVGAAAGWGGLPEREAIYLIVEPRLPVGEYRLTVGEAGRRLLVGLCLQRGRLLRGERAGGVQHQLRPHHGGVELHGSALPAPTGDPRRDVASPHRGADRPTLTRGAHPAIDPMERRGSVAGHGCSRGGHCETLAIRQPQASKHLQVLREAGVVSAERDARRLVHRLRPEPFEELADWVDSFGSLWETRLDSLDVYLDRLDHDADPTARND